MRVTFDLKAMLDNYEGRTGFRPSYAELAHMTKLSPDTIKSLATRPGYNATLQSLSKVGAALGENPCDYMHWEQSEEDRD